MSSLLVGSGLLCAVLLGFGFGILGPIGTALTGICNLLGIASGLVFVGLLEGQ